VSSDLDRRIGRQPVQQCRLVERGSAGDEEGDLEAVIARNPTVPLRQLELAAARDRGLVQGRTAAIVDIGGQADQLGFLPAQ
jgi:hypothetical protein